MTAATIRPDGRRAHPARRLLVLARCLLALGLLLAAGCGGGARTEQVTIMVPWSGQEFQAFHAVLKDFEHRTHIQVNVQVTRALTQQLDAAVAAGAPPDLAILPSVGAIEKYAHDGLQKLDVDTDAYLQPFRGLTKGLTKERDAVYAVPVKADVKSLTWFDRDNLARPPASRDALRDFSRTHPHAWCLGLESGPPSGWPGADWIADLLLAEGDGSTYEQWLAGRLAWSSQPVEDAWKTWRDLLGDDTARDARTRSFTTVGRDLTSARPRCLLAHGALSAMGFRSGTAYDYIRPFLPRLEVSADFVGMFSRNNPAAEDLITYLSGHRAQQLWVNEPGGHAFSARSEAIRYHDPVQRRIAALLQPRSGYTLCFGAADAMDPDVSAAFYRAVLDYAGGTAELPKLLADLDTVQRHLGTSRRPPVPPDRLCTTPPQN
jgi:alpha-glucoside transport system substrate-binding protein